MNKTIEYIDLAKKTLDLDSDNKLAKVLGITAAAVSNYRNGKRDLDDKTIFKIADILNIDSRLITAEVNIHRAKNAEDSGFWKKKAKKLREASQYILCKIMIVNRTQYSC